jgi:hypothetical protein
VSLTQQTGNRFDAFVFANVAASKRRTVPPAPPLGRRSNMLSVKKRIPLEFKGWRSVKVTKMLQALPHRLASVMSTVTMLKGRAARFPVDESTLRQSPARQAAKLCVIPDTQKAKANQQSEYVFSGLSLGSGAQGGGRRVLGYDRRLLARVGAAWQYRFSLFPSRRYRLPSGQVGKPKGRYLRTIGSQNDT